MYRAKPTFASTSRRSLMLWKRRGRKEKRKPGGRYSLHRLHLQPRLRPIALDRRRPASCNAQLAVRARMRPVITSTWSDSNNKHASGTGRRHCRLCLSIDKEVPARLSRYRLPGCVCCCWVRTEQSSCLSRLPLRSSSQLITRRWVHSSGRGGGGRGLK